MDFRFSPPEEAFRQEIRDWLKDNLPDSWKGDRFTRGEGDETATTGDAVHGAG